MMVDITNVVIFNGLATLFVLFWMYRNSILTRNYNEKIHEQFYQENRNLTQYMNDTIDKLQTEIDRRIDDINRSIDDTNRNITDESSDLYRRLDDLRDYTENLHQKSVDGINSRIPL